MCWICDGSTREFIAGGYLAQLTGVRFNHNSTKLADAFAVDGVGGDLRSSSPAPLLLTADTIPDDTSSTFTIAVDGDHIVSTIDTLGDQDFFQVQLEAGHVYDIGQYL